MNIICNVLCFEKHNSVSKKEGISILIENIWFDIYTYIFIQYINLSCFALFSLILKIFTKDIR